MTVFVRITLLALLLLPLSGCSREEAIQQRTNDIKRFNEAMDRKLSAKALQMIRKQWLIEGNMWYGRMPEGAIARLDSPTITVEPIRKGRPFYSGWAGDITITSHKWTSRPETRPRAFFTVKYRATFKDLNNGEIEIAEGPKMALPSTTEVLMFQNPELLPVKKPEGAPSGS